MPASNNHQGNCSLEELNRQLQREIAEKNKLSLALSASEERFRSIVETTNDWIWEIDPSGHFTYANPRIGDILGIQPEELAEKSFFDLISADESQGIKEIFEHLASFRESLSYLETSMLHKNGSTVIVEIGGSPFFDGQGRLAGYRGINRDVTERRKAEDDFHQLAYFDVLTGLPNRTLLNDRLGQALAQAKRDQRFVALFFIDLDRFKAINDALGHSSGDKLLQSVAQRLSAIIRKSDTLARLGGDEFVILQGALADPAGVETLAAKISEVFSAPFIIEGREVFSTASIGIAVYPHDADNVASLIKHADMAMYEAKKHGRNTSHFFSHEMNARAVERMELETSLRKALERNEFFLVYQPQIDTITQNVTGVEALIRWNHREQGLIPPDRFIPLAEETNLIIPIGEWVLRTAIRQASLWRKMGYPAMRMSVNLSYRQFSHPLLARVIEEIIQEESFDPAYLELELTESILMENVERVQSTLHALKNLGITIAIDDFGTGYSSLSYLKNFPIDRLKIDKTFVRDISTDSNDAAIADSIISLARSLGLQVIAEGVETLEQLTFLNSRHCSEMQGYLFSKPLNHAEMEEYFRALMSAGSLSSGNSPSTSSSLLSLDSYLDDCGSLQEVLPEKRFRTVFSEFYFRPNNDQSNIYGLPRQVKAL